MSARSGSTAFAPRMLAALGAVVFAAAAQAELKIHARPLDPGPAKTDSGDYFTESRILFPETAGPFALQQAVRDPEVAAGVSLRYRYNDDFDAEFDVFVYPLGDAEEKKALEIGEADMLATLKQAQNAGLYEKLDLKRTRDVEIPIEDGLLHARHLRFTAIMRGVPSVSHTILAYRDSYLIKLRASSPRDDKRKFEKLVDESVKTLLPKISVRSIGACSRHVMHMSIDPGLPEMQDPKTAEVTNKLLRILNRKAANGCVLSFDDESVPAGMKTETLRFRPGSWGTKNAEEGATPASEEASTNP